uniref:Putative secreted protein n=1 Tax=Ixodes ricinus TaxID=34613 RepID=A0A6B0U350_IXORI
MMFSCLSCLVTHISCSTCAMSTPKASKFVRFTASRWPEGMCLESETIAVLLNPLPITDKSSKLPTLASYLIMSGFFCTSGIASEKLEASDKCW